MSQYDAKYERRERARAARLELKKRAVALKGGGCEICGYNRSLAALCFHHPDPRFKDFAISEKASWPRIELELMKVVLLCQNCHAETHDGWHPQYLTLHED